MAARAALARASGDSSLFTPGRSCASLGWAARSGVQSRIATDPAAAIALLINSPLRPRSCRRFTGVPPVIHEDIEPFERLDMMVPVARNEDGVSRRKLGLLGTPQ